MRNFTRGSKNENLVQQVELMQANPAYAKIPYPDGREATVSLDDLARAPESSIDATNLEGHAPSEFETNSRGCD